MTIEQFHKMIERILKGQKLIDEVISSDYSLLVSCCDKSNFVITIKTAKNIFYCPENAEEDCEEYLADTTKEDFMKDLASKITAHPAPYYFFLIFLKLSELEIIDTEFAQTLLKMVVEHEEELNIFILRILRHRRDG